MSDPFIAVDWGTTNRRAYLIDRAGQVAQTFRDDRGATSVPQNGFPQEIRAIRERLGDHPVLCAGMVGSNRGWVEVPYVPCPAGLEEIAARLHWIDARTAIVPGLLFSQASRRDVMRGEEVQLAGAIDIGLVPSSSLLCQPGTHCKWAWTQDGRIDRFVTAATGELFALLRAHSLLAPQFAGVASPGPDFLEGVAASSRGDLAATLFSVRADLVSGARLINDATSYVSGLMIGDDVRNRIRSGETVYVLADPVLGDLYVAAIEAVGGRGTLIDSHAAFVGGVTKLWRSAS